jgi:hypothetical protein
MNQQKNNNQKFTESYVEKTDEIKKENILINSTISTKNLIKQILKSKKPVYLMIFQAINKILNVLIIKEDLYFSKKKVRFFFDRINFYKTKPYKKVFEGIRSYKNKSKCLFCNFWIEKTHFHRHIDECKKCRLEKDFCNKCKKYVIFEIIINEKILHKHICYRKPKTVKMVKSESKSRWKRRKLGEKKNPKNFNKRNFYQQLNGNYLKRILSDFINQRRNDFIKRIEDIKNGYPDEYLNLYRSETDFPHHFKLLFKKLIGKIGRFYGDTTKESCFDLEKEQRIRKKYESNFKFINSTANEQEIKDVQEKINFHLSTLKKNKIPKFRQVKIYEDLTKTYLLACAERRKIDEELKIAFMQVTKLNSRTCVKFSKFTDI